MRALCGLVLLVLGGCAATQSNYVGPYDASAPRALCPAGTLPIYETRGMTHTFNGCLDYQELRFVRFR